MRLPELAQRARSDEKWQLGVVPENRCLFLGEEGGCKVYASRPSACRKLLVSSDPTECFNRTDQIRPIFMPKAEIILSAALNLEENKISSMASMLYEIRRPSEKISQALQY